VRYLLLTCGWLAVALGTVGIALPVLPTTPFVLLAAACFVRSSERLHDWLLSSPRFGPPIRDYLEGRGLTARTKALALVMLWASVLTSAVLFVPLRVVDLLLIAIAAGVSVYILRLPLRSFRSGPKQTHEETGTPATGAG
jgi:uncharacterized membrane protein YbaN (DUF454 family)